MPARVRQDAGAVAVIDESGKEVATREYVRGLSASARQDAIGNTESLADLRNILNVDTRDWSEIEPSFEVVKDKATFEGIPLIIGGFRFNESPKFATQSESGDLIPSEFVSMLVAGYDPDTGSFITPWVIVNDGSTGIKEQLKRYADQYEGDAALAPPLTVTKGLRRSDYEKEITVKDGKGKDQTQLIEATTWYLG